MIRFLENPDDRTRSVIDASPTDIDQLRPVIGKFLRRKFSMLGREGIEDVVQHVMSVASAERFPAGPLSGAPRGLPSPSCIQPTEQAAAALAAEGFRPSEAILDLVSDLLVENAREEEGQQAGEDDP